MNIIIFSGERPNCASCGKPLPSWNPLEKNEECVPCIANRISDHMIKFIQKELDKIKPQLQ